MRGAGLRPNPLKAMTDDLIAMKNEDKHDSVDDTRGSKVQNQKDSSMNQVREDDNGMDVDEEADNGTDDDDDEDTDQEEGEEEDDEDTDKEGGEEEDEGDDEGEEEEGDEEDEDEAVESEGGTKDGTILSHDDILNIIAPCHRDESVSHVEIHAHQPQASSSLNNNDEIRIAVQAQDLNVLPSKSSCTLPDVLLKRMA